MIMKQKKQDRVYVYDPLGGNSNITNAPLPPPKTNYDRKILNRQILKDKVTKRDIN